MISLKPTEDRVLRFICEYYEKYRNAPLEREIAETCKISRRTTPRILERLFFKGFIDWFAVGNRKIIMVLWKP